MTDETKKITSGDDVIMGGMYRDVVTKREGICVIISSHITGCDSVILSSQEADSKSFTVDVESLEYVDEGVSESFVKKMKETPGTDAGGPAVWEPA